MSSYLQVRLAVLLTGVLTALAFTTSLGVPANAAPSAIISNEVAVGDGVSVTFYLPLKNEKAAEAAAVAIQTPGNPAYHKFISVPQFVSTYGPSNTQVAALEQILVGLGFKIQYVVANHLAIEASSSAGNAERVFDTTLMHMTVDGRAGIAPVKPLKIPQALVGLIRGIGGLSTISHLRSQLAFAPGARPRPRAISSAIVGGTPGNYLPADYEKLYDVGPIKHAGVSGRGTTIGIVTLASFNPADAYLFWNAIGLKVSQSRITKVSVDGGDVPTNLNGEDETDLDVEYSGAIAPDAKVRVYIAPNTNSGFINGFEAAASENLADTLSVSWGQPELDYFSQYNINTTGSDTVSYLLGVFHDAFLELALQGQSLFAATGDSGAFDTVRGCPFYGAPSPTAPTCNAPYSVDHPASDPLVTGAGGTTVPWSGKIFNGNINIAVTQERAWSFKYLTDQAAAQGKSSLLSVPDVFAVGAGGGVSSYWPTPWYQLGTKGVTHTRPGQSLTKNSGSGDVLLQTLPAYFAGRNLPDISSDADPESGYQLVYEGGLYDFGGGTSFVAPQLNGVDALFVQSLGQRVGQLSPAIFQLAARASTDVTAGDNWGYLATAGYNNASARKVDAAKLLAGLYALKYGSKAAPTVWAQRLLSPAAK